LYLFSLTSIYFINQMCQRAIDEGFVQGTVIANCGSPRKFSNRYKYLYFIVLEHQLINCANFITHFERPLPEASDHSLIFKYGYIFF